jgi:hypothetical protein
VKIIDFNVSKCFDKPEDGRQKDIYVSNMLTRTGHVFFRAPEMMLGDGYE